MSYIDHPLNRGNIVRRVDNCDVVYLVAIVQIMIMLYTW